MVFLLESYTPSAICVPSGKVSGGMTILDVVIPAAFMVSDNVNVT